MVAGMPGCAEQRDLATLVNFLKVAPWINIGDYSSRPSASSALGVLAEGL